MDTTFDNSSSGRAISIPGLGHAGVVVVDGTTGATQYYEYGRYDELNQGEVRVAGTGGIPAIQSISVGPDGIDSTSFTSSLEALSDYYGLGTPGMGTVFSVGDGGYDAAVAFAAQASGDPLGTLGVYSLNDNHCYTFAKAVAEAAGATSIDWIDGLWFQDNIPSQAMLNIVANRGGFVVNGPQGPVLIMSDGSVFSDDAGWTGQCFGPDVPIDMWPLDPDLKPGLGGIYDQDEVRAKVWKKPIELIEVGDIVVSFDDNDNLVPGPVTRTFQNDAKILLDFHGTRVTPGHVYYRPDSKKSYKYETLIDVLRDDGVIKHQDGTLIRAATNVAVDSPRDGFVQAVTQIRKADGTVVKNDEGRIRLGTRFLVGEGKERKSFAVADLIEHGGGVVGEDELIRVGDGEPMPFLWDFGETLPKPEGFVLACSGTTLEDIYKAAEWESQGPRLPAPMVLDCGPVQPLTGAAVSAMPRNEPLDVVHSPTASA